VTAIVFYRASAPQPGAAPTSTAGVRFPVTLAEAYATEFGQVYLNVSPAIQAQREQELAGSDPAAERELMNELPAFFHAYASGDGAALSRFAVRGVSLAGLGGAVTFDSIAGLHVPPGGATRQISVTVIWQVPDLGESGLTKLEMAYGMSVVDLQSGKWYVNEISASTEAVGAK